MMQIKFFDCNFGSFFDETVAEVNKFMEDNDVIDIDTHISDENGGHLFIIVMYVPFNHEHGGA